MKYLRKIFESDSNDPELEKILDTFIDIIDEYGDPTIYKEKYINNKTEYTLFWETVFQLGHSGDRSLGNENWLGKKTVTMDEFVNHYLKNLHDQANKLWSFKDDLLSSEGRLSNEYDMQVEFICRTPEFEPGKYRLTIRLCPKVKYDMEFITEFENGILHFDRQAINKFFGYNQEHGNLFRVDNRGYFQILERGKWRQSPRNTSQIDSIFRSNIYGFVSALRNEIKEKNLDLNVLNVSGYLDFKITSSHEFSIVFN